MSFFPILHRAIFGGSLFVIEEEGRLLASFTLDTIVADYCKPEWFTHPADPAFYLRSLSVRVDAQGRGVGRAAMAEAENLARKRGMKALRCDAYEGAASAGGFYEKCGFKPLRRGAVNGTPIVFYEKLLRG
ncbi:MAG: GNAT family N-acetyltransferase [Alphaproteobacteria bacterium]